MTRIVLRGNTDIPFGHAEFERPLKRQSASPFDSIGSLLSPFN